MSQENVAIFLEAFRRLESGGLDAWAQMLHPEVRMTAAQAWPEQGPFAGRDAVFRQFERLFADWSENRFEEIQVVEETGDWVVLSWVWHASGGESGLNVELRVVCAARFEDGRIIEAHFGLTDAEALEAAGLSE